MKALFVVVLSLSTIAACAASAPSVVTPPHPNVTPAGLPASAGLSDGGLPAAEHLDAAGTAESPIAANQDGASQNPVRPDAAGWDSACNDQSPQDFLVRGNFLKAGPGGIQRAIQYRTDQYGYFKGFGRPSPDALPPSAYVVDTTFMGLPVKMHRKVSPALKCVEVEIRHACADHPYTPHALAGIRYKNTYRGSEVTNHAYGIAIDIDPGLNTCCGCVKPWTDAPGCKKPAVTEYDRMAMPECWVHAFERFGFYWLGHDALRDTMHFEFLGDPDRISK